ncbi:hypothetical protein [Plesiocystis pacifica]|nr:hypothetical protein [Plesiocystis pacifica]
METVERPARELAARLHRCAWLLVAPAMVWILRGLEYRVSDGFLAPSTAFVAFAVLAAFALPVGLARRADRRVLVSALGLGLGGAAFVFALLAAQKEALDWLWFIAVDHSTHPDCVVPQFWARRGYLTPSWLGLIFLLQAHALALSERRREGERVRGRVWRLSLAWGLGALLMGFAATFGLSAAALSGIAELGLLAAAPIVGMVVVELSLRVLDRIPELPTDLPPVEPVRVPAGGLSAMSADPAATAQGHRMHRRALAWRLPLVVLGVLASMVLVEAFRTGMPPEEVVLDSFAGVELLAAVVALGTLAALVLRRRTRKLLADMEADPSARPDSVLSLLLAHLERSANLLERGLDEPFAQALEQLPHFADALDADERASLERLHLDARRLYCQLFDVWEPGQRIAPQTRRTLYHQLRRFIALAQGRQAKTPYRAQRSASLVSTGLEWLRGGRSPSDLELSQTSRRLELAIGCLAVLGVGFAAWTLVRAEGWAVTLCVPGVDHCRVLPERSHLVEALGWLIAAAPVLAWAGTVIARWSARRSLALALPPSPALPRPTSTRWRAESQRHKLRVCVDVALHPLVLTALAFVVPALALLGTDDLGSVEFIDLGMLVGPLVALGLIATPVMLRGIRWIAVSAWRGRLRVRGWRRGQPERHAAIAAIASQRLKLRLAWDALSPRLDALLESLEDQLRALEPGDAASAELCAVGRQLADARDRGLALSQAELEGLCAQLAILERVLLCSAPTVG